MKKRPFTLTAAALAAVFALATIAPARADQAAVTRNEILGGVALVAGIVAISDAGGKNAAANAVQGYTPTGDTVYRDGRVVTPNGSSFYPRNQKQSVACRNGSCGIYDSSRGYDGHRPGWSGDATANAAHGGYRRS